MATRLPQEKSSQKQAKTSVKRAFLCLENDLQTSWGNQRENNDKTPINGKIRARHDSKIKAI